MLLTMTVATLSHPASTAESRATRSSSVVTVSAADRHTRRVKPKPLRLPSQNPFHRGLHVLRFRLGDAFFINCSSNDGLLDGQECHLSDLGTNNTPYASNRGGFHLPDRSSVTIRDGVSATQPSPGPTITERRSTVRGWRTAGWSGLAPRRSRCRRSAHSRRW